MHLFIRRALDERPTHFKGEWPKRRSFEDTEDTRFALRKLKALLDFGIDGDVGTAMEVARFHDEAFAEIKTLVQKSVRYKLYSVHAEIWDNGTATWGYNSPEVGAELPGFNTPLDLDEFLQSLSRIDVRIKLEALAA